MNRPYINEATILPFPKTRASELRRLSAELSRVVNTEFYTQEEEDKLRLKLRQILSEIEQLERNFRGVE